MRQRCIACLLVLIAPSSAWAQEQATQQQRSNFDHLRILEPFLGRWVYEGPVKRAIPGFLKKGAPFRVEMAYRWAVDKNAIVLAISIRPEGAKEFKILEMIGWDVRRQMIVSGAFNSTGGMSFGQWRVDENRLIVKTRDISGDGKESSATIVHELQDDGILTWSETDRVVEGEERPDGPAYELKRVEKMK